MKLQRYRIVIEDAGHLRKVLSMRISRVRLWCTLMLCALVLMGIGAALVYLSPVKRRIPGFMSQGERSQLSVALARLDTLGLVAAANQAYVENVTKLLDTDRAPGDSALASARVRPLPPDSLQTASLREREFVASMEEREKYNLNVLSPVAADGVIFYDPTSGGIVSGDSRTARMLQIIMPVGQGVSAIADGHVVDRVYDATEGTYSLVVQSRRGFLTRYSHLGTPLVDKGDAVLAGQCITLAPERRTRRNTAVGIEMWREGTPLIPGEYLLRNHNSTGKDITAPRGK